MMKSHSKAIMLFMAYGFIVTPVAAESSQTDDSIGRGEYVFALGGCASCHTDSKGGGEPLAGGLKMETPFGIFYPPNISPDPTHGIGGWSQQDFITAMKQGISPEGEHYYPAFPYTSYTRMSDTDVLDLKAYLDAQPAVSTPSKPHELSFPFDQRSLLVVWKWLNFDAGGYKPNPEKSPSWNRGAYIVNGPGHCGECHTPRNLMGGLDRGAGMVGNDNGPEGEAVPGLDGSVNEAFRAWEIVDIVFSLEVGMKPDGDFFSGSMADVVDNSTSRLTEEDRQAIAEYLKSFDR